jgi:uncharacterized membrane protein
MLSLSNLRWRLRIMLREIWVRVTAFGVLGIMTALSSAWFGHMIPADFGPKMGADAVQPILTIMATAMLTATTFSLQIMITAFGSAQTSATPRAIKLMQTDRITQNVLASFIGSFVFSLVGLIALQTQIYGASGRFLLLIVTIGVVAIVVVSLLRWVQHLSEFGRLGDVISRVENAAANALRNRSAEPHLGAKPWEVPPTGVWPVKSRRTGNVQHTDMAQLQEIAQAHDCHIWLCAPPGNFVHPAADLVVCDALPVDAQARAQIEDAIIDSFAVDHARDFEQDPQFGLIALAEIASRALSPAVNDPGTGIDILGRLTRVLANWAPPAECELRHDRVYARSIPPEQLIEDAFSAIARDGAGLFEVALRLQVVLDALAKMLPEEFGEPAAQEALRAALQSEDALPLAANRARITAAAAALAKEVGVSLPA